MESSKLGKSSCNRAAKMTSCTFTDVDEAEVFSSRFRPVKVIQLNVGSFNARVDLLDCDHLLFFFADLSTSIHHVGERRAGFIQFDTALTTGQPTGFFHGQPFNTNTLAGFDIHRGTDTIVKAGTLMADVHIRHDAFETTCQAIRRDDLNSRFLQQD
jgi:hypothetical protein